MKGRFWWGVSIYIYIHGDIYIYIYILLIHIGRHSGHSKLFSPAVWQLRW